MSKPGHVQPKLASVSSDADAAPALFQAPAKKTQERVKLLCWFDGRAPGSVVSIDIVDARRMLANGTAQSA